MRPLRNLKNLPNLASPLTTHHASKNQSQPISHQLITSHSHQIIFNSSFMPLQLDVQASQSLTFQVLVANNAVQVKSRTLRQNLPLQCLPKQWVKVDFGQSMRAIQVKPLQKQNKSFIIPTYSSEFAWRTAKQRINQSLKEVSLSHLVSSLKQSMYRQIEDKSFQFDVQKEKQITIIKNRTNSIGVRPKLLSLRERSVNLSERNPKSKDTISQLQKKQASKSVFQQKQRHQFLIKQKSLTSSNSTRLPKKQSGISKPQVKQIKKVKLANLPQEIELDSVSVKYKLFTKRPKFYERIPFTYQEIQLKRKKFDSQCVSQQQSRTIDMKSSKKPIQVEESTITEDICKGEESHISCFQDTLEKGMQRSGRQVVNCEQSGTLCESVFE